MNEDTPDSKNCSATQMVSDDVASLSQINSHLNDVTDLVGISFGQQPVSFSRFIEIKQ